MQDRILLGTRKGTFIVDKTNGSFRPRLSGHAGAGSNYVVRDPETGTLWAALGHGHWGAKLSRSVDDGKTWSDATQIKYPEGARYLAPPMPDESGAETGPVVVKPATLLKLWVIAFGPGGKIYVGTIPGGLFVSSDGGTSFELNRPLWNHASRGGDLFAGPGTGQTHWFGTPASDGEFAPGIHSIQVDAKNPNRILVAISTAGVLESLDGGLSWSGRNKGMTNDYLPDPAAEWGHDPHYVDLCASDSKHVWQQNHSGVFYSSDGAESWRKVSQPDRGVHFGFPVAVDARDGKTAFLVPGKADMMRMAIDGGLFVARTSNGGESWEPLRKGLPQENAYDVVYRHALACRGDLVAFGSTTGNLYVSEDRGDSWVTVANNLPPIYSVRFG
ncbi:MAG: exo-alpha-sialidase [Deltaproteobacteria bacterium]|nr:exo-alpha-sialidase [Deltaproteobacteria bacterium]